MSLTDEQKIKWIKLCLDGPEEEIETMWQEMFPGPTLKEIFSEMTLDFLFGDGQKPLGALYDMETWPGKSPLENNAAWVCSGCYDKLGREYECFTDYNFMQVKCHYCGEQVGEHHVVNPPERLPEKL